MAGLVPLSAARFCRRTGLLGLSLALVLPLSAAPSVPPAPTNAAPSTNAPPAPAVPKTAAAPTPARPPEEYFSRYGKILSLNDQPPYPFKLSMPFPGVGEVKIPSKQELEIRRKLEQLATLSDAQIRDELNKWPAFAKMSLGDEGAMLTRIQQFRDHRTRAAQEKARHLGLVTLNPTQQASFEKEYWDKRLKMDQQLSQQLEPAIKAAEQKLDEDLFREFSSPGTLAQGPKPPAPPTAPAKPAAPAAAAH